MQTMQELELLSLLRRYSYSERDFTLTSNKPSTYFIDVKRTAYHPRGAQLIGEVLLTAIFEYLTVKGSLKVIGFLGLHRG